MTTDDKLMAAVIRKGIEFKVKSGELLKEKADKILESLKEIDNN